MRFFDLHQSSGPLCATKQARTGSGPGVGEAYAFGRVGLAWAIRAFSFDTLRPRKKR